MKSRVIAALFALVISASLSFGAAAQKGNKVIRLEEITVEGRIQKPQAFYILPRSNLDYEALERSETFLPKIEEAVKNEPF